MATFPAPLFQRLRMVFLAGIFLLISLGSLRGQSTSSSLSGTVKDPRGAVVPERSLDINRRRHWGDSRGRCRC